MRTQYYSASSLDGFIATEDDSLEWLFPLGGINDTGYPQFITGVGALAMGAATFFVLCCSSVLVSACKSIIPSEVRITSYILIIATFVTLADMRGRFQIAFAVIPGQQHIVAEQLIRNGCGTLQGSIKID